MDTDYRIGQPLGMDSLLGDWKEWGCKGEVEGECRVMRDMVKNEKENRGDGLVGVRHL